METWWPHGEEYLLGHAEQNTAATDLDLFYWIRTDKFILFGGGECLDIAKNRIIMIS